MSEKKRKLISTFSKSMTEAEANREMELGTPIGQALKKAQDLHSKRREK